MDATAASFTPRGHQYGAPPELRVASYDLESMQTRPAVNLFDDDFTPMDDFTPIAHRSGFTTLEQDDRPRTSDSSPSVEAPPFVPASLQSREPSSVGTAVADTKAVASAPTDAAPVRAARPNNVTLSASQHALQVSRPNRDDTRVQAVRGNRLATGGPQRQKLTEEELAQKMSEISLKNASLEAAFARSQADAQLFAQREEHAATIPREERKNRQQMMGEREKNRLRKLNAQSGRAWDVDKEQDDSTSSRGERAYGRGVHGGVTGRRSHDSSRPPDAGQEHDDGREYMYQGDRARGAHKTRGRARGRGRDHGPVSVPRAADFPGLPKANENENENVTSGPPVKTEADKATSVDAGQIADSLHDQDSPDPTKKSWAEMVE